MPVSFLNPWLWLGLAAIGAPVWLHLRRKRLQNLLRFSTLRFLEDQPAARRTPFQLRDILLFALRASAIFLLAGAFAWPYVQSLNTAPVKESRVYVLDNTLSHQANDGFTHKRDQLAEDLPKLDPAIQSAVIELTGSPRVVASFADPRAAAAGSVRELKPSFQRGSYLAAFRQASALLENSLGQTKTIVFLGDNQQNQWRENVSTPPFLKGVQIEFSKSPAASLPNLSLADPRVQRLFLGDRTLVNFTVRLSHSGPAKNANVVLKANGQTVFTRTIELENQPPTMMLQGQWEAEPNTWILGEAVVEGAPDALAADNHVYFSLSPVVEGKLALLAQSPYVRLALSPDIMRGQWSTRNLDATHLADENAKNIDADVLCIESGFLQSMHARKLVQRYLAAGRGVFMIVNRSSPAIDGFLRELGFEVEGVVHLKEPEAEKFQFVLSNHPIFHPFLSPDYGNLMEIKVSDYIRLKAAHSMPLVFGNKGEGLFFVGQKDKAKLLICAFGLDREHTSWPIHQTFIPFLDLAFQNARQEDSPANNFEPGQLINVTLPDHQTEAVLRDGKNEIARYAANRGAVQIQLPDKPGLFALTYGDEKGFQRVFSINPSAKESELAFAAAQDVVENWRVKGEKPETNPTAPAVGALRMASVLQQRFWWWMLILALFALAMEMLLVAAKKEEAA